jgi:hypothetical protein
MIHKYQDDALIVKLKYYRCSIFRAKDIWRTVPQATRHQFHLPSSALLPGR